LLTTRTGLLINHAGGYGNRVQRKYGTILSPRLIFFISLLYSVSRFAISPINKILAASFGIKIIFYDLRTSDELGVLWSEGEIVDFSPDGKLLAVGGPDGVLYLYGIPSSP
jgi:WD40 repeat protein